MSRTINSEPTPEIIFTSLKKQGRVPRWATEHTTSRNVFQNAIESAFDHSVIVIRENSVENYLSYVSNIRTWLTENEQSALKPNYVLSVDRPKQDSYESIKQLINIFPHSLIPQVEVALGPDSLQNSVWEALAKQNRRYEDPLDESSRVEATTEALQAETGRLSAKKIASSLSMPVAVLAQQMQVSRQAVSKTPDSKALQPKLQPYARIIRLRSVLNASKFKKWLNHPFTDLDGQTPHQLMLSGHVAVVADFAEDALLGTPS